MRKAGNIADVLQQGADANHSLRPPWGGSPIKGTNGWREKSFYKTKRKTKTMTKRKTKTMTIEKRQKRQ